MVPRGQRPPHQGNRPHNAIPRNKQTRSCDPKGVCPVTWPTLLSRYQSRTQRQTETDHYKLPLQYRRHKAPSRRQDPDSTETRKSGLPGAPTRRGTGTGPHCLESLVICDLRFESQIAIAIKSRTLDHLELLFSVTRGAKACTLLYAIKVF